MPLIVRMRACARVHAWRIQSTSVFQQKWFLLQIFLIFFSGSFILAVSSLRGFTALGLLLSLSLVVFLFAFLLLLEAVQVLLSAELHPVEVVGEVLGQIDFFCVNRQAQLLYDLCFEFLDCGGLRCLVDKFLRAIVALT